MNEINKKRPEKDSLVPPCVRGYSGKMVVYEPGSMPPLKSRTLGRKRDLCL
jgi:hypothetical protein